MLSGSILSDCKEISCLRSAVVGGLFALAESELELLELSWDAGLAAAEFESASPSLESSFGMGSYRVCMFLVTSDGSSSFQVSN